MSDKTIAVLLGILEGLTEFIPVSSTGHLVIFGKYLEFQSVASSSFEIFIQLGAILAVLVLYFKRFLLFFDFKNKSDGLAGSRGIVKMVLACLPVAVMGFLFYEHIKKLLQSTTMIALALIVGGVLMIIVEKIKIPTRVKDVKDLSYRDSFLIGVSQCFSLWPGFSRSASTIVGGMLLGLKRAVAAEFSFLVAVPVISMAAVYDLLKNISTLSKDDLVIFFIGFIVSFLVALISIKFFLNILKRFSLTIFGYYRIILAVLVLLYFNN